MSKKNYKLPFILKEIIDYAMDPHFFSLNVPSNSSTFDVKPCIMFKNLSTKNYSAPYMSTT